jgi:long-chain acyl-CoA synthetase
MNENLACNLTDSVARGADRPALRVDDVVVSYGQLDALSAQLAGLLRARGIGPSDRVGIMLPNVPQFAVAYYAVLRAGAIVVPMNVLLKRREVSFYLSDSEASLLIAWHGFADAAQTGAQDADVDCLVVTPDAFERELADAEPVVEVADAAADDTAVILYTSGTTGTPKGAELTHANLKANVDVVVGLLSLGPDDIVLGALPMFHVFGQTCGLNAAIAGGACLTLVPRFDPAKALAIIERDRVSVFEGVPTMYSALLHDPAAETTDVSSLRMCVSGGAALPVEVLRGFEERFGCTVLEGYGLSETSPVASFNHPDRERLPGSIGTAVRGVELRLIDDDGAEVGAGEVGEIAVRGHNVMKGYWRRPEATAEAIDADGWFKTGDLARVDDQGRYFIVDRKKEMIIRGGYNVYPREIEEVLYEHPAVREAAVIGIPHPELGEEIAAVVSLKPGAEATPEQLREHVKEQVAAYKYPRHVWAVDELPKGPTGKILKREITPPAQEAPPPEE